MQSMIKTASPAGAAAQATGGVVKGLLKLIWGSSLKATDDIVAGGWRTLTGGPARLLNRSGAAPHPTEIGKMVYNPTPWNESIGFLRRTGDILGRGYNNAGFIGRYGSKHLDEASQLLAKHPHLQKWAPRVVKGAVWTGLGTTMADAVMDFTGNTDNPLYGIGKYNPYHQLWSHEYSPGNWLWSNTTPWGLALTHGAPWVMGKLQDAMAGVGTATIDRTADALSDLGFAERLAYLFDPSSVSNKYREQAKKALAEQLGLTGDNTKDKALQDVARTVKTH